MKTSLIRLSSSFFFLSISWGAWAKPVAQVVDVSGTVFVVNAEGKTTGLKLNQHIEDKSEILVEEDGSITVNDYYDATYHLIGGSHLKFFNKSVQLKKGKAWIQAATSRYPLALTTANGHVDYLKSEFIATFDQATSRTQVLVVSGDVEVSNILNKNYKSTVTAGTFTLVDPEVENGIPRLPVKVGLQSLDSALSEFKKLPKPMLEGTSPARSVASLEEKNEPKPKGEIIFITSERKPASVDANIANKYFKKVMRKKSDTGPVPIKIYGIVSAKNDLKPAPRSPASIPQSDPPTTKLTTFSLPNDPQFADSLKKHEQEQPKHSKELESLIEELRSY